MNVKRWFALTSLVLALGGMPGVAAARPRVRVGVGVRIGPPVRFYRPFPRYHSWGGIYPYGWWNPWWYDGPRVMEVERVDYGTIQFDVKPVASKVYVDGKYMGVVDELQGRHHETKLPPGCHEIKIESPAGVSYVRTVYLATGDKYKFEFKFEG